jgi:DNA-binding CsgD family transcriptional regulator
MSNSVMDRDLRDLVNLVEEAKRAPEACGMPPVVLELLQALVPCDVASFNDLHPRRRVTFHEQDYPSAGPAGDPGADSDDDPFWAHYWQSLPCSYPSTSGDERSITTISDFYTDREWHATGMYIDCLKTQGVEREAMLCLSAPAGRSRRILLFRSGLTDFDGRDRMLLALLRPHLNEVYQDLQRSRQSASALTARQRELLKLVAVGWSNLEIARALKISPATVRTHLEHIFKQLDVASRTAAAARAFPASPF